MGYCQKRKSGTTATTNGSETTSGQDTSSSGASGFGFNCWRCIGCCGRVFAFTVLDFFIRIIAHTTHSRLAFFISWLQHAYEIRCWGETL